MQVGRDIPFSIEPAGDPPFDRRLVLPSEARGRWIVLGYRTSPTARPLRPMIRFQRAGGAVEDAVLPGDACGAAYWLGFLPSDLDAILLAAEPGFVLERVVLRSRLGVPAESARKSPLRLAAAGYAWLRGDERRPRNTLRAICAATPITGYTAWKAQRRRVPMPVPVSDLCIRLVLPLGVRARINETIDSLKAQSHPHWTLLVASTAAESRHAPATADTRVTAIMWNETASPSALVGHAGALGFLRPGDVLEPEALAILACRLSEPDPADLVYADEETTGPPLRPRLKPDWSPDLALVTEYQGAPTLLARSLCERLAHRPVGPADGLDLTLAATSVARDAIHVPRILCRRHAAEQALHRRADALGRHLAETGSRATGRVTDGVLDLDWPRPDPPPLVSVVIPSRDRPDLIGRVTAGILQATDYPALELIVVDNGSTDPSTLRLYESLAADPRVRIEPYPHPFNFSAMVNAGVRVSRGGVLVLLNNDVAVLKPDWLDALVAQAVRPEVGAIGAKLLYPDGSLQHAGVVVGLAGRAGHILRRRPGDTTGHLDQMRVAHEVSAVTAACLAVERVKYDAVGGLDARTFPIDFNDVDLCLRLAAAGWKTMWTPKAVLTHLESVSRGAPVGEARTRFEREARAFAERWREKIRHDPYYHPALSLTSFGEDLE